jgi:hypothetical protein
MSGTKLVETPPNGLLVNRYRACGVTIGTFLPSVEIARVHGIIIYCLDRAFSHHRCRYPHPHLHSCPAFCSYKVHQANIPAFHNTLSPQLH